MIQDNVIAPGNTSADDHLPPHVPHTHTNPAIIQVLKFLPLISILQKNKEIETKNTERALKTLNHTLDKDRYPDTSSDATSLITLDSEDREHFKVPSFATSFCNYIYSSLAKWIMDEELKEKEVLKLKRKVGEELKPSPEEVQITK
jgi:hypothetical protein